MNTDSIKSITVNVLKAKKNRDNICLLGGQLAILKRKVQFKQKITQTDLNKAKSFLTKIDKFDIANWHKLLKTKS